MLGHDVCGDHASSLTDVELVGPIVVVGEFILGEAPGLEVFANFFGDAGVVGEGPHESFLVVFVVAENFFACGVVAIGVFVVLAYVVGGDGVVVVGICFAVGHEDGIPGAAVVTGFKVSEEEFVFGGIVVLRFGPGTAVGRYIGCAEAVAVGLDAVVAGEFLAWAGGVDAVEET